MGKPLQARPSQEPRPGNANLYKKIGRCAKQENKGQTEKETPQELDPKIAQLDEEKRRWKEERKTVDN